MFKIGEFSKLNQVSVRMLRYYDEMNLLKPAQIDRFSGYRLYSSDQIPALNKIVFLRDLGFSVAEIATTISNWDNDYVDTQLDRKWAEIEMIIESEQAKLSKIQMAKRDIKKEKIAINYNVSIKSIPSYQVFSLRRIVPSYYSEGLLWKEMSAFVAENNVPISSKAFTIYHDMDYREKDIDMEVCAPVPTMEEDKNGFVFRNTEPVEIMACTLVHGSFENIAGAFLSFAEWLNQHEQYKMAGQSRQIVHKGQWNEVEPDKFLTEIQIPLKRR